LWGEDSGPNSIHIRMRPVRRPELETTDFTLRDRANCTKIGFLSKYWEQAMQKITIIDTLEYLLTETVDEYKLSNYYATLDPFEALKRSKYDNLESAADRDDECFTEIVVERIFDVEL